MRADAVSLVLTALMVLGAPGAGCPPLAAQDADTVTLTLEQALGLAGEYSPDVRRARNEMGLSETGRRAAWGAFLPSLDLRAGTGLRFNRRLRATDNFGNPIENPETEWRTSSSSSQGVSGNVTLFQGGSRFHELSAAGARADSRAATARARLLEVEAQVARRYWEAARSRALLSLEEDLLAGRERDLEVARRRFELAGVTRVDVLAAEQSVREQEQALRRARSAAEKARLTLVRTIGDPDLGPLRLEAPAVPGSIVEEGARRLPPEDSLVAAALARNPRVVRERTTVRAAEASVSAAAGSRWPEISLSYGFDQNTFADESAALFDAYPDDSRFVSTSLNLRIPLFSRFQVQDQVRRARVEADNARETLRSTRLQVEEEVRSRVVDLRTSRQGLRIARQARELAEERLELAREQYRQGTRSFSELQRDIEATVSARRSATNALYDYLVDRANLAEVVGGDVWTDPGGG